MTCPGWILRCFIHTGGAGEIQRLQMATQEGANVAVYAVQGNFDDAQTGVKKVFGDPAVAAALAEKGVRLSSANSINWGRLVPQIVYYFAAYGQLLRAGRSSLGMLWTSVCLLATLAISWRATMPSGWACRWGCWLLCVQREQCPHGLPLHGVLCSPPYNSTKPPRPAWIFWYLPTWNGCFIISQAVMRLWLAGCRA